MAAAVVDTAYLSAFTAVPQASIETLVNSPTTELVTSFLQSLIVKAQEYEKLKSERLRLDVELENAVRGGEARARASKATADKALEEVETLRRKLNEEETTRSNLTAQVQTLQNSTSSSSTEVNALHDQISRLERASRETTALLESKSTSYDKLGEQLADQHQKTIDARKELASLQDKYQTVENNLNSAKFRESSLQQEIEMLKKNNEWLETELKNKATESSKFRKEKNARIAELQRANDDANANIQSVQKTENALRKRLTEIEQKADEAFTKIQQLQEDAARQEENFRAELDSSRRLAELQAQSADTARRRVQELDRDLQQSKDDAADEISQLQQELEAERQSRESVEQTVEHLEEQIATLEAQAAQPAVQSPATPRGSASRARGGTPGRAGSPTAFTPGSARPRSQLNMTQLYSEYSKAQQDLESEKRRNMKLTATMDDLIHELEKKEPEMQELQLEHTRLEGEVSHLSQLLAKAGQEKDAARKESRKWESQVEGLNREAELLRQQLRDLSSQIKVLLVEVQIRSEGSELTAAERQQLQAAARGENEQGLEGMTDSARFISQRLVAVKDVFELQETNAKLLHLTRTLTERMEGDEAREKQNQQEKDQQELTDLRDRFEKLQDEMKSLVTQSQSYIRERDMFRRMLSHRGQIPADADVSAIFGASANGAGTPRTPRNDGAGMGQAQSPKTKENEDLLKFIKELQAHFDNYKQEAATDHSTLKDQLDRLAKEKSDLQGQQTRSSSQLELAQERYNMLQSNYDFLKAQHEDAQARAQSLAESAARQDVRTQQAAEELVEARSLSESMRNENSNLKAEKELWKRIEARLSEDNQSLIEERGRLNKMISDTQSLYNERELTESETRRKLEKQVENLESDLQKTKQKLDEELDESRKANQRREYDAEQSRTRIDDLMKGLSHTKEELVAAKSSRDQLQARVDELKIELRTAEERTQVLQPRPSARPDNTSTAVESDTLSREQELGMEVTELRRELDLVKSELEKARADVEQYKAISQSSEEELQNLNESHDQYREEMDKAAESKDAKIKQLEQRVDDILSELNETNNQISELRSTADDNNARLDQQKASFEAELGRIRDESERHLETAKLRQEDLKEQAEIAQRAQQQYDAEVVNHAEARKTLQQVRADFNKLKLDISEAKADAEAARLTLSQSEESWGVSREKYEHEITELKTRRDDIAAQNTLLHKQLESVSSQIASLQQKRVSTGENTGADDTLQGSGSDLQNLQEVIKYLRREKEIVDVQYELSVQEGRRLRQQLEHTQQQLDETRLKLDQERQRQGDSERISVGHKKLMDAINELNVFRESNVTLRAQLNQTQTQLADKSKRIDEVLAQVEPLQSSVRDLEADKETAQGEIKLLQEDRDRWQQRTQQILSKYDRVDPAELENLKTQITELQNSKEELETEKKRLQERVENIPNEINTATEEMKARETKIVSQFKERSRMLTDKIRDNNNKIAALQSELDTLKAQKSQVEASNDGDTAMANGVEEGQVTEGEQQGSTAEPQDELAAAKQDAENKATRISELETELSTLQAQLEEVRGQLEVTEQELSRLRNEAPEIATNQTNSDTVLDSTQQQLSAAKEELQARTKELEALRANLSLSQREAAGEQPQTSTDENGALQQLRTQLESEYQAKAKESEETFNRRAENMKTQLRNKLNEAKTKAREELVKEFEVKMDELKAEHETTIENLKAQHQQELEAARLQPSSTPQVPNTTASQDQADTKPPEEGGPSSGEGAVQMKSEGPQAGPAIIVTDEQARWLCKNNATIRQLFVSNINKRVDDAKSQKDKEYSEKLEDARQKADKAKESAVNIEGRKSLLKINMAENRARTFQVKLEVVESAAKETPQKPVVEVWEVAKDVKPEKPQAQQPAQIQSQTALKPLQLATGQLNQPQTENAIAASATQNSPKPPTPKAATPQRSSAPSPKPAAESATPSVKSEAQATQAPPEATAAKQTAASQQDTATKPATAAAPSQAQSQLPAKPQGTGIPRGGGPSRIARNVSNSQTKSRLPDGPLAGGAPQQQGSGLPRGGGIAGRAGGATGRGGGAAGQQTGRGGNLNAAAGSFQPQGSKRPRQDSNVGVGTNKRGRGQ